MLTKPANKETPTDASARPSSASDYRQPNQNSTLSKADSRRIGTQFANMHITNIPIIDLTQDHANNNTFLKHRAPIISNPSFTSVSSIESNRPNSSLANIFILGNLEKKIENFTVNPLL